MSRIDIERCVEGRPDAEYICVICHGVLDNPHITSCKHIFCKTCICTWLKRKENCPSCRKKLKEVDLEKKDNFILGKIKIYCKNKELGCAQTTLLKAHDRHLNVCQYEMVACPFSKCPSAVTRRHMKEHKQMCEFSESKCKKCSILVMKKELDDHECLKTLKKLLRAEKKLNVKLKEEMTILKNQSKTTYRPTLADHLNSLNDDDFDDSDWEDSSEEDDDDFFPFWNPFSSLLDTLQQEEDRDDVEMDTNQTNIGTPYPIPSFDDLTNQIVEFKTCSRQSSDLSVQPVHIAVSDTLKEAVLTFLRTRSLGAAAKPNDEQKNALLVIIKESFTSVLDAHAVCSTLVDSMADFFLHDIKDYLDGYRSGLGRNMLAALLDTASQQTRSENTGIDDCPMSLHENIEYALDMFSYDLLMADLLEAIPRYLEDNSITYQNNPTREQWREICNIIMNAVSYYDTGECHEVNRVVTSHLASSVINNFEMIFILEDCNEGVNRFCRLQSVLHDPLLEYSYEMDFYPYPYHDTDEPLREIEVFGYEDTSSKLPYRSYPKSLPPPRPEDVTKNTSDHFPSTRSRQNSKFESTRIMDLASDGNTPSLKPSPSFNMHSHNNSYFGSTDNQSHQGAYRPESGPQLSRYCRLTNRSRMSFATTSKPYADEEYHYSRQRNRQTYLSSADNRSRRTATVTSTTTSRPLVSNTSYRPHASTDSYFSCTDPMQSTTSQRRKSAPVGNFPYHEWSNYPTASQASSMVTPFPRCNNLERQGCNCIGCREYQNGSPEQQFTNRNLFGNKQNCSQNKDAILPIPISTSKTTAPNITAPITACQDSTKTRLRQNNSDNSFVNNYYTKPYSRVTETTVGNRSASDCVEASPQPINGSTLRVQHSLPNTPVQQSIKVAPTPSLQSMEREIQNIMKRPACQMESPLANKAPRTSNTVIARISTNTSNNSRATGHDTKKDSQVTTTGSQIAEKSSKTRNKTSISQRKSTKTVTTSRRTRNSSKKETLEEKNTDIDTVEVYHNT